MKASLIFFIGIAITGCAGPPKEVAHAWRQYSSVKVGMTWQQVHALAGGDIRETIVGGPYREFWTAGDMSRPDTYGVSLRVFYDGVREDGRVERIVRSFHRPDTVDVRP